MSQFSLLQREPLGELLVDTGVCVHCVAVIPLQAFVLHLEGHEGCLPHVVLHSLWQVQHQVHKAPALQTEPAKPFDAKVEIS